MASDDEGGIVRRISCPCCTNWRVSMVSGVVFDMDGTLVDTEHVHFDAWNMAFGQFGIGPFDAHWFDRWIGRSAPSLGAQMVQDYEQITVDATELVARKEALFVKMARDPAGPVQHAVFDGIIAKLDLLQTKVAIALCTSSFKTSCGAVLSGTGLEQYFSEDRRTCLDDVELAKPHPEPYQRAAKSIQLSPCRCVALEDSASGVRSAVGAGYGFVIGVLTTSSDETLKAAGAHATFADTITAVEFLLTEGVDSSAVELKRAAVAKL